MRDCVGMASAMEGKLVLHVPRIVEFVQRMYSSILFYSILFYSILFYSILFYSILVYPFLSFPVANISFLISILPISIYLSSCGDASCNGAETCTSCPLDCRVCPGVSTPPPPPPREYSLLFIYHSINLIHSY